MDCLRAASLGNVKQLGNTEVRVAGGSFSQPVRFVGFADMQSCAVRVGIDGDRGNAHLATAANNAYRDLSAVGNQDLVEHSAGVDCTGAGVCPRLSPKGPDSGDCNL